ncbi:MULTISPECIES: competence protein CoiA [Pontibacillus]|uniref:Competence protein CoiA family protein n=1 Tax=Pontibacillus chungwhensis TaxID=265426 RepID=A0ABY8V0R7_9BACI|nr:MULTISPECIES: competence protein CoiA family protein [Pontibacillus]MCD5324678.1 competence protein CoiA [Pontibacillus sp. HN14]WIF99028.1 competence protein CoiA family protein [Pontibacillus chungwhensis]
MLKAITKDGIAHVLARYTKEEIYELRRQPFYCPACSEEVTLKAGSKVIPHYAHKPHGTCRMQEVGEGAYHEAGKWQLYEWLRRQGYHVELEAYLPSIQQRPDLLLTIREKRVAIEYQCCRISPEMIKLRTEGYRSAGIIPLWILGGNRLKRAHTNMLSLTSFEKLFLQQFKATPHPMLLFYCSSTHQFARFYRPLLLTNRKSLGKLSFFPSTSCSLTSLLSPHQTVSPSYVFQSWLKEKRRFRKQVPRKMNKSSDFSWRQWLYLRRLHPSTLSALIHLPVPFSYVYELPPYQWQAKILMDEIHPQPTGEPFSLPVYPFSKTTCTDLPLLPDTQKPIELYTNLLCEIGILKKLETGKYVKLIDLPMPTTVHEAIEQDEWVLKELLNRSLL